MDVVPGQQLFSDTPDVRHRIRYTDFMRDLPSHEEAAEILRRRRTRPVRRPPPAAGRAVARVMRTLKQFGPSIGPLQSRWREIVGEVLWRNTEPVKLVRARGAKAGEGATLELRVNGANAAIIQHQAEDIVARVNLALGAGAVSRLRIVQGLIRRAAPAKLARRRPPLDAAKEAELSISLAGAPDGKLKTALLRLGRAVLRNADD